MNGLLPNHFCNMFANMQTSTHMKLDIEIVCTRLRVS